MPANADPALLRDLTTHLTTHHLPPSASFLSSLLASLPQHALNAPLPSLRATVLARFLAADLRSCLDPSAPSLAQGLDPAVARGEARAATTAKAPGRASKLHHPVLVQVLDKHDVSTSSHAQLEALESAERGEARRGREVVRVPAASADDVDANGIAGAGAGGGAGAGERVWRLLLQDRAGHVAWAAVLSLPSSGASPFGSEHRAMVRAVLDVGRDVQIGCKVLLGRGTVMARGVVLLPGPATRYAGSGARSGGGLGEGEGDGGDWSVLGGKIERMERAWREGRVERLKGMVGGERESGLVV